jgi:hypothetical protein
MGKEICNLTFTRESGAANQNWGFRIIGGTDQGQTYKVSHSALHAVGLLNPIPFKSFTAFEIKYTYHRYGDR